MSKTVLMDLAPPAEVQKILAAECVEQVEPLDAQFGEMAKLNVPESLNEHVFAPDLTTYAVIDAAAVPGLTGMVSAAGLPHACLFKGGAEDELEDTSPWIIQLDPENAFTRKIFTKGRASWQMWRKPTVLLIQSRSGMDEVRAHLRKFTRVQDSQGKWMFFRFWELPVLRFLRKSTLRDDITEKLLGTHRFLYPDTGADGADCLWMFQIEEAP